MKQIRGMAFFVLLMLCGLLVGCQEAGKELTVVFGDGKGLAKNARVYQAGVAIGKVVSVGLDNGKAAVRLHIALEHWPNLKAPLAFYIDTDPAERTRPAILVRSLGGLQGVEGQTLQGSETIEGVDSFFVWKVLEFAQSVSDLERSEFMQHLQRQLSQQR